MNTQTLVAAERVAEQTRDLLTTPAVVSCEQPLLRRLDTLLQELGCTVHCEDDLVVASGRRPYSDIITAHIDRHGLICSNEGEYQYAAHYAKLRTWHVDVRTKREALGAICLRFNEEPIFAYHAETGGVLGEGIIRHAHFCDINENLVFTIDGLKPVPPGTPISFSTVCEIGRERLIGQLDNILSASVVLELFARGFEGTALLSTDEEVGQSWAHILDHLGRRNIESQRLIVMDTSPFDSTQPAETGYVVLRNRDEQGVFCREMVERLKSACAHVSAPYVLKDEVLQQTASTPERVHLGRTELGRLVQESNGRINGVTVQIPTYNYHTNKESTTYRAIENTITTLTAYYGL